MTRGKGFTIGMMEYQRRKKRVLFYTGIIFSLALMNISNGASSEPLKRAPYHDAVYVGDIGNVNITDASGLAFSRTNRNILWIIDDTKNELFAVNTDGKYVGSLKIIDSDKNVVPNLDWEDAASFTFKKKNFLLIADTGRNKKYNKRKNHYFTIYVVIEPIIEKGKLPVYANVEWEIKFKYPHDALCSWKDAESVAVDVVKGKIFLLTKPGLAEVLKPLKERCPPVLYSLPLRHSSSHALEAVYVTQVRTIPPPSKSERVKEDKHKDILSYPTAMDISADGSRAMVMTYRHAYLFEKKGNESWASTFNRAPLLLPLPPLRQGEALCFGSDERTVFVTSEQKDSPSPIFKLTPKPLETHLREKRETF